MSESELADGMIVRRPYASEIDQVCELLTSRGDPEDADDLRLVIKHPDEGMESCRVVVTPDGTVASTATLLRETVRVGSVALPAGQVELVATNPSFERRGLVRSLMEDAHRRSAERGDAFQVMIGIPHFYRRFGYEYAMPIPRLRTVPTAIESAGTHTVREADSSDLPLLAALNDRAQSAASIAMNHSDACWSWMLDREASDVWVAESGREMAASARVVITGDGVILSEIAGSDPGVDALFAHAHTASAGPVQAVERPHTLVATNVERHCQALEGPAGHHSWYYGRVSDFASLLQHLSPELQRRWSEAGRTDTASVLISFWRSHVAFEIGPAGIANVRTGGPEQSPISKGGSGLPPDSIPELIFGPDGALGIEEKRPDCYLGTQRDVLDILFPPQLADLMTFYLPV